MSTESVRCSEKIWENFYAHRCSRKGVLEREGKFYCKQHDPVAVEKRKAESSIKFNKELNDKMDFLKRQGLCIDYCKNLTIKELERRISLNRLPS